jgi:ABC-2 type transport system permease protein
MNLERVSALTSKELKRIVREPANLFIVIVFPLVLTLAFGASFGAIGGSEIRYPLAVVNQDTGSLGLTLKTMLNNVTVIETQNYTDKYAAQNDLQQGKVKAVLIIPEDFTTCVNSYKRDPSNPATWHNTTLDLSVDKGSMVASAAIPPIIRQVVATIITGEQSTILTPVRIGDPIPVESQKISQFAYMAPGMFSYATVFLIMVVAQALTVEREQGILKRITVTPTTVGEILGSQLVSNLIVGVIQVAIVLGAAYLMGFKPQGGALGLVLAVAIVMMLTVCSVGFGLITAAFAKSSGAATGISFAFIIPLMFLGTFVPAPDYIARLVPTWYVTDALTSIFLRGAPLNSSTIINDVVILSAFSIAIIVIGIIFFRRFGKP